MPHFRLKHTCDLLAVSERAQRHAQTTKPLGVYTCHNYRNENMLKSTKHCSRESANCGWNLFKFTTTISHSISHFLFFTVFRLMCHVMIPRGYLGSPFIMDNLRGEGSLHYKAISDWNSSLLDSNIQICTDQAAIMTSWRTVHNMRVGEKGFLASLMIFQRCLNFRVSETNALKILWFIKWS